MIQYTDTNHVWPNSAGDDLYNNSFAVGNSIYLHTLQTPSVKGPAPHMSGEVALSKPVVYVRDVALSKPVVYVRDVALSKPVVYVRDVALSKPVVYERDVALSKPVVYVHDVQPVKACGVRTWCCTE